MKKEFNGSSFKLVAVKEIKRISDRRTVGIFYEGKSENAQFELSYFAHGLLENLRKRKQIENDLSDLRILEAIAYIFKKSACETDIEIVNNIPSVLILSKEDTECLLEKLLDLPKDRFTSIVDEIIKRRNSIIEKMQNGAKELEDKREYIKKQLEI